MSSSSHLCEGDVDLMLGLIGGARQGDPGPAMPWDTLKALLRVIPCDSNVQYQELDVTHERSAICQHLGSDGERDLWGDNHPEGNDLRDEDEGLWWSCGGWTHVQLPAALRRPAQRLPHGGLLPHDARPPQPPGSAAVDRPSQARDDPPAARTPGLRTTTGLLAGGRPRLQRACPPGRPAPAARLPEIWLDAERGRSSVPRLSAREWEVLDLTAAGLSYAEVAAALFLSVGTVRKHMEHVRERLGVHSAAAAATRAVPHAPGRHRVPTPRVVSRPARSPVPA